MSSSQDYLHDQHGFRNQFIAIDKKNTFTGPVKVSWLIVVANLWIADDVKSLGSPIPEV